jgi:transaldolase
MTGTLPADGGDAETTLAGFASAGVDVVALAATLQREGAQSFAKSLNDLLDRIASKSAALTQDRPGGTTP